MKRCRRTSISTLLPALPALLTLLATALGSASCQSGGAAPHQEPASAPKATATPTPTQKPPVKPENLSFDELGAMLGDPDVMVRMGAVQELDRRAPTSPEAEELLSRATSDKEGVVRRFAASGLAKVKAPQSKTVMYVVGLLNDPDVQARQSAARALAEMAPRIPADAVENVGLRLSMDGVGGPVDPDEYVRTSLVEAMGALGANGARKVPALVPAIERALADGSAGVRSAVAHAAGQLGAGAKGTIGILTKALADPVHDVRKIAVVELERWGNAAAPATKAIARLLHGQEIYLRVFAADALTAIGPAARAALPDLKQLAARGWKDLEGSKESEARLLPEAVANAIRTLEGNPAKK